MRAKVEHVWWHGRGCGFEVVSEPRPGACPRCKSEETTWDDLGWRVGYNSRTYAYYASHEAALRDRRAT